MKKEILLAAALLAGACSKPAPEPEPPPRLLRAQRDAGASQACGRIIPMHWSAGIPVPALDGGSLVYKMFFSGRDGDPEKGFVFHRAEGDATLAADGRVLACSRRAGSAGVLPKTAAPAGLTLDEIERRENALYPALEDAASLYAARRELTADEKKRAAGFAAAFAFFVDEGQGPDYRALSPDFWAWLEKNGGGAPSPK
jgi:hypothetical protein